MESQDDEQVQPRVANLELSILNLIRQFENSSGRRVQQVILEARRAPITFWTTTSAWYAKYTSEVRVDLSDPKSDEELKQIAIRSVQETTEKIEQERREKAEWERIEAAAAAKLKQLAENQVPPVMEEGMPLTIEIQDSPVAEAVENNKKERK